MVPMESFDVVSGAGSTMKTMHMVPDAAASVFLPLKTLPSANPAEGRQRESEAGTDRSRLGAYPAKGLTPATASAGWMAAPPWSMSSRR